MKQQLCKSIEQILKKRIVKKDTIDKMKQIWIVKNKIRRFETIPIGIALRNFITTFYKLTT